MNTFGIFPRPNLIWCIFIPLYNGIHPYLLIYESDWRDWVNRSLESNRRTAQLVWIEFPKASS